MGTAERVRRGFVMGGTAAWILLVSGCAAAFRPPTFQVAEVRLTSLDFAGGTLAVGLDVHNPNRYALESRELRYALAFADGEGEEPIDAWVTLARGEVAEPVRVPGGRTERVEVSIPFEMRSLGAALGRLLRRGELEYRFTGELSAGTPLGTRRIPFDQRGRFRP